jgi:putative ATP-dependent endonuclease of OLD family
VILVEGISEMYIVPKFAELLEESLDENGISVCSVHGTDFLPYARLLGEKALDIPYIIITDGDPQEREDETIYQGNIRGVKIASFKYPEKKNDLVKLKNDREWAELDERLEELGVFIGSKTLEIDLCEEGYIEELLTTIRELGAGSTRSRRFEEAIKRIDDNGSEEDERYVLSIIENYGKGRFAQRLVGKLTNDRMPSYIRDAINFIVEIVAG